MGLPIPDICHNHHNRCLWRKFFHVEKIFQMTDCHVEKFLHKRNLKKIYHIEKVLHMINVEQNVLCGEMWRNVSCGEMFPHDGLLHMNRLTFFCCKICFVAIYAVLLQNLFCHNLCALVWRKVEPKIVSVGKNEDITYEIDWGGHKHIF